MTDPVAEAMRQAARTAIVPRFRSLTAEDVIAKGHDDVVTTADHECERLLVGSLGQIAPDVAVLAEEAAASDPDSTNATLQLDDFFVVDPLDGTKAFVAGSPDFAVMVARIERGVTTAAWIWHPMHEVLWSARRGEGAWRNGDRQLCAPASGRAAELRGAIKTGHMDKQRREQLLARFARFSEVTAGPPSAGFSYPELITGEVDFTLFWRTLPWDHAPGVLIAEEAGCHVRRLNGSRYRAGDGGVGLLSAAGPASWEAARAALFD